jgi:N-acetylmuramoyl-L-alanine amidase CwlA
MRRGKRIRIKNLRAMITLIVVLVAVIAVAISIPSHLGNIPTDLRAEVTEIEAIPVITDFIRENTQARPGHLRKIKYIVIHETGNSGRNANAASHNNYIHTEADNQKKSWHYTVDDQEIYYHIPDNEVAFHAGDGLKKGGGNMNGIGIEMCINPENDYELTLKNTAKLTAMLLESYDLDTSDIKMHKDFSGKHCPDILLNAGRWEEFISMVELERLE